MGIWNGLDATIDDRCTFSLKMMTFDYNNTSYKRTRVVAR